MVRLVIRQSPYSYELMTPLCRLSRRAGWVTLFEGDCQLPTKTNVVFLAVYLSASYAVECEQNATPLSCHNLYATSVQDPAAQKAYRW